jgi:hypothetical protein
LKQDFDLLEFLPFLNPWSDPVEDLGPFLQYLLALSVSFPEIGLSHHLRYFLQPLLSIVEVKDNPEDPRGGSSGL